MTGRVASPDYEAVRRTLASAEVVAAVRRSLGLAVEVDVVDPETLPRSMGKLRRLYDLRDRG